MLEMRHVTKIFNPGTVDEKIALNDLSFTLNNGDFVTVIGGNGAGKSTMQNAICGTWLPDAGEILLDGIDLSSLSEHQRIELLCKVMSDLKNAGHQIILVSSGAIAMGFGKLNLPERPKDVPTKQASAAVGQCELMYTYDKLFTEYNHTVAQLLITRPDITGGGQRRENFHVTLERLLELGALPIINENDTISTEEISIGDNDTLSAMVAASIRADLLILLSDIDGLYDSDPHKNPDARLIPVVERLDDHIRALAGGSGSSLGTGGMVTKLQAAQIATEAGCEMVIANGHHPAALYDIAAGQPVGTRFLAGRKDL